MDTVIVYVLRLEEGKWYIGSTTNMEKRYEQHKNGEGCDWTRKYPPKRIAALYSGCTLFDEDKCTKISMAKFGIENVRGGAYCSVILSRETIVHLERELIHSSRKCYCCKKEGHLSSNCPDKAVPQRESKVFDTARQTKKNADKPKDARSSDTVSLSREDKYNQHVASLETSERYQFGSKGCYNCHQLGHIRPNCPTLTCDKCGGRHYANECNN